MIYICSPYSSPSLEVMEERYQQTLAETARLIALGFIVFSPIVHCHEMAKRHELPREFHFWEAYCIGTLDVCRELWVYTLPGWEQSRGVQSEIAFAKRVGKAIRFGGTDCGNYQYK